MRPLQKPIILFLLHLPPPVHGSSIVGKIIFESVHLKIKYDNVFINLLASNKVSKSGKLSFIKIIKYLKTTYRLFFVLLRKKVDLCYFALTTTGFGLYKDFILVLFLKLFQVKIVYHLHNKGVASFSNNRINYCLYKFIFNNSDVIVLSKYLYDDVSDFVHPSRLHVCSNGVPKIELQSNLTENSNAVKLLFLSNLIESKGLFDLLHACKILKEENINFICHIIGSDGDVCIEKLVNKIHHMELDMHVIYLGPKYDDDKDYYFNYSDIFLLPTYYSNECFPIVILEAMRHSLPVISTFEGGIPDIVDNGKTGFLIKKRNVNDLVFYLKKLISDEELRFSMGKAGRLRFEHYFTQEIFEERLSQIMQNVILK